MGFWKAFARNEDGATALEYALIVATVFLAIVSAVTAFAGNTTAIINRVAAAISTVVS